MGKSDFEPTPVLERCGWVYGIKIAILVHSYIWFSEFRMKNHECETVISALSVSLSQHLKLWKRRRRLNPHPRNVWGGKTRRLQIGSFCFQASIQERNWFYLSFGNDPPEAARRAQTGTCSRMLQKQPFVFEKNFLFSKMTLELKIYVVHSSPCVPQGLRQLGWVPTMY